MAVAWTNQKLKIRIMQVDGFAYVKPHVEVCVGAESECGPLGASEVPVGALHWCR